MVCALFGASTLFPALAQDGHHGQGHAESHDWYQELKQPGTGFSCCNGTVNGVRRRLPADPGLSQ